MYDPIALAIPGFFVLIAAELGLGASKGRLGGTRPLYRYVDALTDLGCGVTSQVTGMFLTAVVANGVYTAVYNLGHLWDPPRVPGLLGHEGRGFFSASAVHLLMWIFAFIAVDFLYYWWHRASHRVNLLWAAHVVHHQSEDYNLAVALRQSILTALTTIPFYLPLAILGVPPIVFFICSALNTLYQFWIHTRLVGTLGPLEWVMNTPSHHRVHHGINPAYIDKNHAGVFIAWDRWFGTFVEEGEEPIYGTVQPFRSADPLWANVEPLLKLTHLSRSLRGWDRLKVWFAPPEWHPDGNLTVPEPGEDLRWTPESRPWQTAWTALWFVTSAVALTWVLLIRHDLSAEVVGIVGLLVFWTITSFGWLYDQKPLWRWQEPLRLAAVLWAGIRLANLWLAELSRLPT